MTWEFALERRTEIAATASELPMDSEAFTGFYERSARPLWAYLVRVSGNPALSEDLMQESFVRFLCAAHRCEGEVEARRYLFRIATNLLRDYWRRPVATSIEELPEGFFASNQGASDISSEAILGQAMTKIKPRDRQLLWLAHAEGYSHREIAEVMGLGAASVRLLLFRARRKLAGALQSGGAA